MDQKNILVTGATGNVGSEIVRQLAAAGSKVKAFVRNPAKAHAIKKPGVEIIEGDMSKPSTLDAALRGIDAVMLISTPEPNQVELQSNVIKAAQRAGVKHIVKLSTLGADLNSPVSLAKWHAQTEKEIEASGLPYTFLRPNFFMQNTLSFAPTIAGQGVFYACMKEGRVTCVDIRDIAAVAVGALTGSGHEGKSYLITGPEALTLDDIAAKISSAVGKKVTYQDVTPQDLIQSLKGWGMPEWFAKDLAGLYQAFSMGYGAPMSDSVEKVGKKKPTSFDQFAKDFAGVWKQQPEPSTR